MPAVERRACTKCGKNRALRFYVSDRGRVCSFCRRGRTRSRSRDVRLAETYGITLAEYDAILVAQGGGCAICGGKRKDNLDVDHDHALERALRLQGVPDVEATRRSIRGLLCKRCNRRLLPAAQDSVERLIDAIEFLLSANERTQEILACPRI